MSLVSFMLTLTVFYCVSQIGANNITDGAFDVDSLRLLIIFFRHGARSPSRSYNSDPHKDYKWPDGWGSLTRQGKNHLYELGKNYRKYYSNFIPEEYHENDVYVRSSDKSRCLMSAYTFLAGLFPPSEEQTWHPQISWQPIPVHSLPRELDDIVAGTKPCKLYKQMYYKLLNDTSSNTKFKSLFTFLSEKMNESVSDVVDINYVYSSLLAQVKEGLELPEWSRVVFPEKLLPFYTLSLALLSYNESMQRLRVGPLLNEFRNHFEDVINKKGDRKLFIYSGHDVNVVSLWRAVGFQEMVDPEYGASLAIELHQENNENEFYVKVFFRNNTSIKPLELNLPHCNSPCRYNDFMNHINKLIPLDWHKECKNK